MQRTNRAPVVASHSLAAIVAAEAFTLVVRESLPVLKGGCVPQVGPTSLLPAWEIYPLSLGLAFAWWLHVRQLLRKTLQADLWGGGIGSSGGFTLRNYPKGGILCAGGGAARLLWMWVLRGSAFDRTLGGSFRVWRQSRSCRFTGGGGPIHGRAFSPGRGAAWALW